MTIFSYKKILIFRFGWYNMNMLTSEGKKLDVSCPRSEYPTPQFQRESYLCLNGVWDFALDEDPQNHSVYPEDIVVPFAVETELSGVHKRVSPNQVMHYRRYFELPADFNKGRVLLHFEAVDQVADVYLNGVKIGHHEGGFLPFTFDCMELRPGQNELLVDVRDDTMSVVYPRGKQSAKPGGIWYTATSGIWGTVWLESVPKQVIQSFRITPLFDEKKVQIDLTFEGKRETSCVEVFFGSKKVAEGSFDKDGRLVLDLSSHFREWSPEHPNLYDLKVRVNEDEVSSYFAMRKFSVVEHEGHKVFGLNNKPYFLSGVLDQGYFSDGGLTAASDAALSGDVKLLKEMGFNMARKHIKIECMRWYYHCDRLGLIVMQDFINGGRHPKKILLWAAPFFTFHFDDTVRFPLFGRASKESRDFFEKELPLVVDRLYNVPSIAAWTLFNEGWGQFDSVRLVDELQRLDPTRLVDANSGWFDQGNGDFYSRHIYFRKVRMKNDHKRIMLLSEFGAYSCIVEGHCDHTKKTVYKYFSSTDKLCKALIKCYKTEILPKIKEGLSAIVLTQLSDVEEETNGLITYDRKVVKVDKAKMREVNALLKFEGGEHD